jgi:Icc-related predicted phosphoesterase
MRILHYSDNHGLMVPFPLHNSFNVVISTGDWFPNSHHVFDREYLKEAKFQMQWLRDNVEPFREQLRGYDFLFVLGNHDFVDPEWMEEYLRSEGIGAINLNNKCVLYGGIYFYGFPYVPVFHHQWNYELEISEMQREIRRLVDIVNENRVDVLACHCPPYGCLDITHEGVRIGNRQLSDALDYKIKPEMMPRCYLTGHDHNGTGVSIRNGMLVSNMATSQCIIEIE